MKPLGWRSPFLDDVVGQHRADSLRALTGSPARSKDSFSTSCIFNDSYLESSFSSPAALLVVLIALGAGLAIRSRKHVACALLGVAAGVSVFDTWIRLVHLLQRGSGDRDVMLHNLPGQLAANVLFQLAIPFAIGLALAAFGPASKRLIASGRSR